MVEPIDAEKFRSMWRLAKSMAIEPKVVRTAHEAAIMTELDPAGHQWQVGEQYYVAFIPEPKP